MEKYLLKIILIMLLCIIALSCGNSNRIHFRDYPADYEIAYFEDMGVINIPSINDLFGKNASYTDEFAGTPVYVIIESYDAGKNEFSVEILVRVKETEYNIVHCFFLFEADDITKKSYVRYAKVTSLLSDQFLESKSDGSVEQDLETFELFVRYMHLIWK